MHSETRQPEPAPDAARSDAGRYGLRLVAVALLAVAVFYPGLPFAPCAALGLALGLLSVLPHGTRRLVAATMVGMGTCQGAILLFTTGIFQDPITAEFGWTHTQYFLVTPLSALGAIVTVPLIGGALDRYGVRRVVLPSVILMAGLLVVYSRLTAHLWNLYLVAFLYAVLGAGTTSGAYARVLTFWFERRRGLALGAGLAGVGIGGATLSPLVAWMVHTVGWRNGFLGLALFILLVPLPILWLWLHDSPGEFGLGMDGRAAAPAERDPAATPPGLSRAEGLRSPVFRRLILTFTLLGFAMGGLLLQMFPILTSLHIASATAAGVLGSMGIAIIGGRALCGFLVDRYFAPRIATAFLLGPVVGCAALASGVGGGVALVAALAVGLASGAEVDVLAYLTARYFGRRAYATLYLWIYVAWSTGSGLGPLLGARISDITGSYSGALWVYAALFAFSALMLFTLGPFPDWREPAAKAAPAEDVVLPVAPAR
jgi:MFS family permease